MKKQVLNLFYSKNNNIIINLKIMINNNFRYLPYIKEKIN